MNIDPTAIPTALDGVHLGLAAFALLLLIILMFKPKKTTPGETESSPTASVPPSSAPPSSVPPSSVPPSSVQQAPQAVQKPVQPAAAFDEASPVAALQLLTLLQQEARFVDFVSEDLSGHSDADIGAVARIVHEGAGKIIKEYFSLQPIRNEQEETRITVPEGFNAAELRLTGKVVGAAPFSGTLIHRGWKAAEVKLPKLAAGHDATVIAAAEVEL